uniref:PKD_channel domain-containing protein n=1 Tax=Steinernema glaseri TaxID=37863 RepID=A0A1I7YGH3_9BILA
MGLEMLQLQNKMVGQLHPSSFQMQETNARLGVGLLAMFFYLLVGAIVFVRIEAPREALELEAYIEFRDYWTQRMVRAGFDEDEIDRLFANVRDAALNGIWVEKNVTNELNWSFGQAFFFSGTLISTV